MGSPQSWATLSKPLSLSEPPQPCCNPGIMTPQRCYKDQVNWNVTGSLNSLGQVGGGWRWPHGPAGLGLLPVLLAQWFSWGRLGKGSGSGVRRDKSLADQHLPCEYVGVYVGGVCVSV